MAENAALSEFSDMINTTGSPAAAVATPKEYFREFSDNNVSEHIEIHFTKIRKVTLVC